MPTMQSLDRTLRTGEELHSVVRTMKGLAAVSIHEYEEAVRALREYTRTIERGWQIVFRRDPASVPRPRPARGRVAAVVVGTDQGLCGPINRDVVHHLLEWLDERDLDLASPLVAVLGVRAARELDQAGSPADVEIPLPGSVETIERAVQELIVRIDRWRDEEGVEQVVVFSHQPLQRTRHRPRALQVVPPDVTRLASLAGREWPTRMIPDFPHPTEELVTGLTRADLSIALYRAIAEARASEHGARLSAMQSAEQNIEERLERLQVEYHQLRQARITSELLDVVSGFEVLESESA